jgi:endonuclease YncB( thermonuclease family)
MKKQHSFLLAFLITTLLATNFTLLNLSPLNRESATVSRVIDGDTLQLQDGRTLRLANINAPEKSSRNFNLSFYYLQQLQNHTIEIEILGIDKYERSLARMYAPSYINLELVKLGYASKFLVDESELSQFSNAEKSAINEKKGMWKHSAYFSCIESKIDKLNEVITIINNCNKINIQSFILKDESTKEYKFKNIELTKLNIHSHEGQDNATDVYWNSKTNIWNNDRDSLYLFDTQGNIVNYNSYGY